MEELSNIYNKYSEYKSAVNDDVIRPPLGLTPKKFHDERVKIERFNEVCGAIVRYYEAGLKINIEWIKEYNELVESVGKYYRQRYLTIDEVPNLFVTLGQQIHYESVVNRLDMTSVIKCFNELQEAYKKERSNYR